MVVHLHSKKDKGHYIYVQRKTRIVEGTEHVEVLVTVTVKVDVTLL